MIAQEVGAFDVGGGTAGAHGVLRWGRGYLVPVQTAAVMDGVAEVQPR